MIDRYLRQTDTEVVLNVRVMIRTSGIAFAESAFILF